jgi:hypothetical protein
MPLIEIARTKTKDEAMAALDTWKAKYASAAERLEAIDVLVDGMRGPSSIWYRVRINLQQVLRRRRHQVLTCTLHHHHRTGGQVGEILHPTQLHPLRVHHRKTGEVVAIVFACLQRRQLAPGDLHLPAGQRQGRIPVINPFEEHPQAFSDDYGIPESGNGVPDILDEVKWGLDWLVRMQNSDGSLLCVQGLASASPPSDAKGDSYYGPPTTSATLMGAAAYAYASKVFASRPEAGLKQYGDDLRKRATAAWAWAIEHPGVLYYNNDESKQPGSKGLAAGQHRVDDHPVGLAQQELHRRLPSR